MLYNTGFCYVIIVFDCAVAVIIFTRLRWNHLSAGFWGHIRHWC